MPDGREERRDLSECTLADGWSDTVCNSSARARIYKTAAAVVRQGSRTTGGQRHTLAMGRKRRGSLCQDIAQPLNSNDLDGTLGRRWTHRVVGSATPGATAAASTWSPPPCCLPSSTATAPPTPPSFPRSVSCWR